MPVHADSKATPAILRYVVAGSDFLARHRKPLLLLMVIIMLAEGARVAWRGKVGDFGPVLGAINRLAAGQDLYVPNPDGPAYVYSPLFALILAPLHILPDVAIRFLWYLASWATLVFSWVLSRKIIFEARASAISPPKGFWLLAIVPIAYFPYYNALNGQSTPLMMMLVLLSYQLELSSKPVLSGLSLATSMLIKPFPVIFLAFYLLRRRFKVCLSALFFLLLYMIVPVLYFRSSFKSVLASWFRVTEQQQTLYDISSWGHQSISSFWYRLLGREHPPFLVTDPSDIAFWTIWLSIGAIVGVTVFLTIRSARPDSTRENQHIVFALYLLCWALLPPTAWKHYYVVLLFPCALLAHFALETSVASARACRNVLIFLLLGIILLHIKPAGHMRLFYDLSLCVIMALSVFVTLSRKSLHAARGS